MARVAEGADRCQRLRPVGRPPEVVAAGERAGGGRPELPGLPEDMDCQPASRMLSALSARCS